MANATNTKETVMNSNAITGSTVVDEATGAVIGVLIGTIFYPVGGTTLNAGAPAVVVTPKEKATKKAVTATPAPEAKEVRMSNMYTNGRRLTEEEAEAKRAEFAKRNGKGKGESKEEPPKTPTKEKAAKPATKRTTSKAEKPAKKEKVVITSHPAQCDPGAEDYDPTACYNFYRNNPDPEKCVKVYTFTKGEGIHNRDRIEGTYVDASGATQRERVLGLVMDGGLFDRKHNFLGYGHITNVDGRLQFTAEGKTARATIAAYKTLKSSNPGSPKAYEEYLAATKG